MAVRTAGAGEDYADTVEHGEMEVRDSVLAEAHI